MGTRGPRGSPAEPAPPHPPTRPAPTPRTRPAPRNIALEPLRLAPRGTSRPPLAKRSIAPSQPTARCALSLARGGVGGGVCPRGGAGPRSPAPWSLGWAEPAGWLERVGPRCERGARWLLWLLSARDAGDLAVRRRPRRALTDALRRQPFTLEEGKWRSGRFRAVTSGLAQERSPGRAAPPRSSPASGLRGPVFGWLEKAAGQCRLGAAFPAP